MMMSSSNTVEPNNRPEEMAEDMDCDDDNKNTLAVVEKADNEHSEIKTARVNQVVGEDGIGKPTIGEELFRVYLARHKGEDPSEDDYDVPRKRARAIGEELWEVHVRRSRGLEPDFDTEEPKKNLAAAGTGSGRKSSSTARSKKPARCSDRLAKVMHLRNRDVRRTMVE